PSFGIAAVRRATMRSPYSRRKNQGRRALFAHPAEGCQPRYDGNQRACAYLSKQRTRRNQRTFQTVQYKSVAPGTTLSENRRYITEKICRYCQVPEYYSECRRITLAHRTGI